MIWPLKALVTHSGINEARLNPAFCCCVAALSRHLDESAFNCEKTRWLRPLDLSLERGLISVLIGAVLSRGHLHFRIDHALVGDKRNEVHDLP